MELKCNHIIKKQTLDIKFPLGYPEESCYLELKDLYYNRILPGIEKIADEFADSKILLQIDTLEIDVGILDINSFKTDFPAMVEKSFRDMMKQTVSDNIHNIENSENYSVVNSKQSAFEMLTFFLKTGDLPWHVVNKKNI
jgi:hypothetical protein